MSHYEEPRGNRFYRSSDKAILGGVCAGVAEYFGFNLKATRFLCFLGFLFAMPMMILAYVVAVLLIPARPSRQKNPEFRRSVRSAPRQTMSDIRGRFKSLDRRLARLERHVTSSRYQLDREFRDLERDAN